jgi:hypothetical protein
LALFAQRKDYAAAGLTYVPQFSNDLRSWQTSEAEPVVMAEDGNSQIVGVPYPAVSEGAGVTFFRLRVNFVP